jgi:hypothetical protein
LSLNFMLSVVCWQWPVANEKKVIRTVKNQRLAE